jgi:NADH-quinone oxidoreductase subunit G
MRANISVHEPRASQDADTALAFSMEGHNGVQKGDRPGSLIPFAWAPGWNSPQAWNKFQDEVGGHVRAGDPGVRLFEPTVDAKADYYGPAPAAAGTDQYRVLPLQHIFGSEELSSRAAPLQTQIPNGYVLISAATAQRLKVAAGANLTVTVGASTVSLPIRISPVLPDAAVGLPQGIAGIPVLVAGAVATLTGGAA